MKKEIVACKADAVILSVREIIENATIWRTVDVGARWFLVASKPTSFSFETLVTAPYRF